MAFTWDPFFDNKVEKKIKCDNLAYNAKLKKRD